MEDKFEDYKGLLPDWVKTEEDFEHYKVLHTAEHVLNQAVLELWPGKIQRAVAHIDENRFSNDGRWEHDLSEDDFAKIEEKMQEIIKRNLPLRKKVLSIEEAKELFKDNPYKLEWIDQFAAEDKNISVYWTGDQFVDLCKGPHVNYTKKIKALKLLSVAGAYWRGDEKNEMLKRVYGTAFAKKEDLDNYLFQLEEAKKRDHRRLGKELDLFTFSELIGGGLPLYTQRGAFIRRTLNEYVEEIQSKEGYMQVWTPQLAKADLFKTSGHYNKYKDDMFRVVSNYSEEEFYLKPMNCPQHTQIYASKLRSYRDLPIRMTDFAMLYRDEKPGELSGLARVRSFSQDDCHIFCREDQVDDEIDLALSMTKKIMATFGFKYKYRMSIRDPKQPDKYLGDPKTWDRLENWMVEIMKRNNIEYFDGPGEAAFYAPKMDLMATDALGREWQLSTVQIDYVMPARFGLKYTDKDGSDKSPVMIHRAVVGSPERFIMILLEHFGGALPAWISPEQVRLIPISSENNDYALSIRKMLADNKVRVEIDDSSDRMQNKIRKAQEWKVPFMVIIGKQEEENGTMSLRYRDGEEIKGIKPEDFLNALEKSIKERQLEDKLPL